MATHFPARAEMTGDLQFRRLTSEEDLPPAEVDRIFQDSRGFMWFSTGDGLVRYDGQEMRVYRRDPSQPHSLANNHTWDIVEDTRGDLWIGTEGGLHRWNRQTEQFTCFRPDPNDHRTISNQEAIRLLLADETTLWIGTRGGGLNRFDLRTHKAERFPTGVTDGTGTSDHIILCLQRDRRGQIWIGTGSGGLNQLDPATRRFKLYQHDPTNPGSLAQGSVRALAEDRDGLIWIGTDYGLCRLNPEDATVERFLASGKPGDLQASIIDALLVDQEGTLWVGSDGGGLSRYEAASNRFTHLRHGKYQPQTLVSDVIRTIFQDRAGDFWIGHYPSGVSYANRLNRAFNLSRALPGETNSLSDNSVMTFLEDEDGGLWIGTDRGGLNYYEDKTGRWSHFRHDRDDPTSLGADAVLSLFRDHQHQLWVGTWNGGLNRYNPANRTFHRYLPDPKRSDSLSWLHVWDIAEDHQHRLWVATQVGLNRYVPETSGFVHYRHSLTDPTSLNHDIVWRLLISRDGTLWAGTPRGMGRWNPATDRWHRYQYQPKVENCLSHDAVVDICESRTGHLWIATQGGGLNRFDPVQNQFEHFHQSHGLPSEVLAGVLEDEDGLLWLLTNNGLARWDPQTRKGRTYDRSDGLQGRHFNVRAHLRRRNGNILVGGTDGFNEFRPSEVLANTNIPPVVLTRLEVFNREVLPALPDSPLAQSITEIHSLRLPSSDSVINFQFAALNFRSPERNQYDYRLEGFDTTWRPAGSERRATYTQLRPGHYTFHVRAANNEGLWNQEGTRLELVILPMWWQTWWFRGGSATAFMFGLLGAGWWVAKFQTRQRLREAEQQQQLARERQMSLEALRQSEERYRSLVQNAQDGIFIAQDGVILSPNPRFLEMMGYDESDITRHSLTEHIYPEDQAMVLSRHRQRLQGALALPQSYAFRVLRKNGEVRWVELNTSVIQWDNRPATLNILRDITDRKQEEEMKHHLALQIQQTQKLESLGVLAGGIAHDFNNLLTAILGHASLAREDVPPDSPAKENLNEIETTARRAADLCRQMLAYSGKGRLVSEPVDLGRLFKDMVPLLKTSISKKALLQLRLAERLPLTLADATQLQQVVMNLVINASEAIGEQEGIITVTTASRRWPEDGAPGGAWLTGEPAPGHYVTFEVQDTGCGMDPSVQQRIFEPFYTTKFTGRGLGLSAVLGIVRGHKGALSLQSELGQGTTFHLWFPVTTETTRPPTAVNAKTDHLRGMGTVLLVDDEDAVRRIGARIMERMGFTVLQAADGLEAVTLYRQHSARIRFVVLDLTMPRLSGAETLQELRKLNPQVQVILASGYSETDLAHRFADRDITGYIQKPFTIDELRERLKIYLQ